MFSPHPSFPQPENDDVLIWRYIDFTKYVDLLASKELFFARADQFDDPFEGSYTRASIENRTAVLESMERRGHSVQKLDVPRLSQQMGKVSEKMRRCVGMNCWHINENESAAMWNLYLKSGDGVAIRSTYSRLRDCFRDKRQIHMGKVRYVDYDTALFNWGMATEAFMHKRLSYEHEREVRALVGDFKLLGQDELGTLEPFRIKVSLKRLVEHVFVAPTANEWFHQLVVNVTKRYGFQFDVAHSRLGESPLY